MSVDGIHVVVGITVKEDQLVAFEEIVRELQSKSREEDGCVFYTFSFPDLVC